MAPADSERPLVCESSGATAGQGGAGELGHGAVKCFYQEEIPAEDEGKFHVRCFSARDPHGDRFLNASNEWAVHEGRCAAVNSGADCATLQPDGLGGSVLSPPADRSRRTCNSLPLCVKIRVVGSPPAFVAPTPLEANSFDDNGVLVPNRTDVPACEGFPLQLAIAAVDPNPLDSVRIFVRDRDLDFTLRDAYEAEEVGAALRGANRAGVCCAMACMLTALCAWCERGGIRVACR